MSDIIPYITEYSEDVLTATAVDMQIPNLEETLPSFLVEFSWGEFLKSLYDQENIDFLFEIYRKFEKMYPDQPYYADILTNDEIDDIFSGVSRIIGHDPNYKFLTQWGESLGLESLEKEREKLLWRIRDLETISYRRKYYGSFLGYEMIFSSLRRSGSVFLVGEYPLTFNKNFKRQFRLVDKKYFYKFLPTLNEPLLNAFGHSANDSYSFSSGYTEGFVNIEDYENDGIVYLTDVTASSTDGIATLIFSVQSSLIKPGSMITVSGFDISDYNGDYEVLATPNPTLISVSYMSTATGNATGGIISQNPSVKTSLDGSTLTPAFSNKTIVLDISLDSVLSHFNTLKTNLCLLDLSWIDYVYKNSLSAKRITEDVKVGAQLNFIVDTSGFYTRKSNTDYTDKSTETRAFIFNQNYTKNSEIYKIRLGTGGQSKLINGWFRSIDNVRSLPLFGTSIYDYTQYIDPTQIINAVLEDPGVVDSSGFNVEYAVFESYVDNLEQTSNIYDDYRYINSMVYSEKIKDIINPSTSLKIIPIFEDSVNINNGQDENYINFGKTVYDFTPSILDHEEIAATAMVYGTKYRISYHGTTDFTTLGSLSNDIGTVFTNNQTINIIEASRISSIATLTFNLQTIIPFQVGSTIMVSGVGSTYDGSKIVTACSTSSVSFTNSDAISLTLKSPVKAATTTGINVGTSQVGLTLTGVASPLILDGITIDLNDRVLIKNQTDAKQNGIYSLTTIGTGTTISPTTNAVLTRTSDSDENAEIFNGIYTITQNGTQVGKVWILTGAPPGPITLGTTSLNFTTGTAILFIPFGDGRVDNMNEINNLTQPRINQLTSTIDFKRKRITPGSVDCTFVLVPNFIEASTKITKITQTNTNKDYTFNYGITTPGTIINALDMVVGRTYKILTVGSTDYLSMGSHSNDIGTIFTANFQTINIIGSSGDGSIATLKFNLQTIIPFPIGSTIIVSGVNSTYNGTHIVTSSSTSSVSYSSTATGNFTTGTSILSTPFGDGSVYDISAHNIVEGKIYKILYVGNSVFTEIGASYNTSGQIFKAISSTLSGSGAVEDLGTPLVISDVTSFEENFWVDNVLDEVNPLWQYLTIKDIYNSSTKEWEQRYRILKKKKINMISKESYYDWEDITGMDEAFITLQKSFTYYPTNGNTFRFVIENKSFMNHDEGLLSFLAINNLSYDNYADYLLPIREDISSSKKLYLSFAGRLNTSDVLRAYTIEATLPADLNSNNYFINISPEQNISNIDVIDAGDFIINDSYNIISIGNTAFNTIGATIVTSGSFEIDTEYAITTLGGTATPFEDIGASLVNVGSFVVGTEYIIKTPGDSDWISIGAANNNAGTVFIASNNGSAYVGSGVIGKAYKVLFTSTDIGTGNGTAYKTLFIASGIGSGTGSASRVIYPWVNTATYSFMNNCTKNLADLSDTNSSIVGITEMALFNKNDDIVFYSYFHPVIYDSEKNHMSFNVFIKETPIAV